MWWDGDRGAYITGTVVQHAAPSTFSTPALGSDLVILDEEGRPADRGEAFLIPPSMGLSMKVLNRDHHEEYYANTPQGPGASCCAVTAMSYSGSPTVTSVRTGERTTA